MEKFGRTRSKTVIVNLIELPAEVKEFVKAGLFLLNLSVLLPGQMFHDRSGMFGRRYYWPSTDGKRICQYLTGGSNDSQLLPFMAFSL